MLLSEIKPGMRLAGVRADGPVEVVAFDLIDDRMGTLVYRAFDDTLGQRLVSAEDALRFSEASDRRWTFDADGDLFRLASEARRIGLAHLFDPFAAVDASGIDPLPHQIEAVYKKLLPLQPLAFLLADDPGAGKTIMSGLYIRELMLRGALFRCLVVAPGSLVEQWQEELHDKFNLRFEIFTREMVEATLSANPFLEKDLLIARLDQLARNEELQAKLEQASRSKEWDLVIVDEAHKMSAHRYGPDLRKTKRFQLGEKLRDQARNLLLLTATPHNGKDEDFFAFMTLLDPDRFAGRRRPNSPPPEYDDLLSRNSKEKLLTFDGKKLFPERRAETLAYDLSDPEQNLYEEVTDYVRHGMNRADQLRAQNDRRAFVIGFALVGLQRRLASSPEAIYQSLRRRRERVEKRLAEIRNPSTREESRPPQPRLGLNRLPDSLEEFDPDEFDEDDFERWENQGVEEAAVDLADPEELEKEIRQLRGLEDMANRVRKSGKDSKWNQLADFLDSDDFKGGDPPRKLIVFTEHKDTLHYLTAKIQTRLGRTEAVEIIHGGMKREDRRRVQDRFRNDPRARVLVATDAAGEGVNLQRANLMVNYDLPWNPNRIEQRFGRIHRIGQTEVCHLWNLVALSTREGQVFERLLQKLENQREALGDEVYDVLGDPQINQSLQKALLDAIRYGAQPHVKAQIEMVVDAEIGDRVKELVQQRALAGEVMSAAELEEIRQQMELAKARKLSPGFVQAFFAEGLKRMKGRMADRDRGRFEITRVPARLRLQHQAKGPIHDRYERVTFDKDLVEGEAGKPRAELIAPGHPLLAALMEEVLDDYRHLLAAGATLVDESDPGAEPRTLIYLDHKITDGRFDSRGHPETASRKFQYAEVDRNGNVSDPTAEPYLNYRALTEEESELVAAQVDHSWADAEVEQVAKNWAIANLASPHLKQTSELTKARVDRVRRAVDQRLNSEIRFWDRQASKFKEQELQGKKPKRTSGYARQRADELAGRRDNRLRELDVEAELVNHPPTVAAAALVIPQGLLDKLNGTQPSLTPGETEETDRRAVAAVLAAERRLGREPQEMEHNNPGFDIMSRAPDGFCFYIEVKGHKPTTPEIKVSKVQVQQGQHHPDRFRLAVVEVPEDPEGEPKVSYLLKPFDGYDLHFAQASLPLKVSDLMTQAVNPQ